MMMGASCYPPRVCLPLSVLARAQELPQGNYCSSAPQIKTQHSQHSQYSQYSQSAPPAAAQPTAAAMQNLSAQNYRRLLPRADLPPG